MRSLVLFTLLFSLSLGQDPASFVNPLIGTADNGHVFPGQYFRMQHLAHVFYQLSEKMTS